jgi:purine-nucleoside phosphorylase
VSEAQEFYLRQVAISAQAASDSSLANQRDKHLRSQAAWQALADRAGKTAAAKAANEVEKKLTETDIPAPLGDGHPLP